MDTNRYVKWNKKACELFQSATNNSLQLNIVVSHGCLSQTGEGFAELVDTINALEQKIKKVVITDTSYLYRHSIRDFEKLVDTDKQSIWFLNNRCHIDKLKVEVVMDSWVDKINTDEFKQCHKQILTDFAGNNGSGFVSEFRNAVITEAEKMVSKNKGTLKECINFILEERAFSCAFHKNANLIYPIPFKRSMLDICERYSLNITQLSYSLSKNLQKTQHKHKKDNLAKVNQEIIAFLTKTLKVNFFLIDKSGNYIYKNNSLSDVVGNTTDSVTSVDAWKASKEVMENANSVTIEEKYNGSNYVSVKSPLIIDGKIEGVIGTSIDITDRKKAEQLQRQNELQKIELDYQSKIKVVSEQVAHDIRSPLIILSMLADNCKELSEKDHISLRNAITNIESIANNLLDEYEKYEKLSIQKDVADQYVSPNLSLQAIINDKRYQYKKSNVTFNYSHDPTHDFAFIKGSYPDFCRMMSNLLNNSVEAVEEGKKGIVEVGFIIKNHKVEFYIKDNGKGMSQEVVDKIMNDIPVDSSKQGGYGIGMQQIKQTLVAMNGRMSIKSTENVGTEITLIFPESDPPKWFPMKIVLHKGDTVVVLDDDPSIHDAWKRRFADYANDITVKYFTNGRETIDFINSLKEIDKIFLLADYELRGQKIDGVDVIEKSCVYNRSIIVTSAYVSKIRDFNQKSKFIKMFPKAYINEIPITITDEKTKIVDFVFIDDNESLANALCSSLEARSLKADAYNSADVFLNNLHKYSKDTKIVADHELKQGGNGFDLLEKLYERGYLKLYLMSGRNFENKNPPPYVTVLLKEGAIIEKLLANS